MKITLQHRIKTKPFSILVTFWDLYGYVFWKLVGESGQQRMIFLGALIPIKRIKT